MENKRSISLGGTTILVALFAQKNTSMGKHILSRSFHMVGHIKNYTKTVSQGIKNQKVTHTVQKGHKENLIKSMETTSHKPPEAMNNSNNCA